MKLIPYRRSPAGFTLLEIVVVMSIMILVIGLGFTSFAVFDDVDPFEEPVQKLSQMSKFAISTSVIQHRSLTIAFDKKGFGVLGASAPEGSYYSVPGGMKVLIRRMNGKNWEKAEGQYWPFGEQGICEPIKVRFETKTAYRELSFHPLTGMPVD